jgi:thiol:disulfide interchange protein
MSCIQRYSLAAFAALLLAFQSALALAAPQAWDETAFRAAQAAGKPILIDIYADW